MTINNINMNIDFFGDGMRIFLAYISRQYKKNPDYKPHPIIRAFECALEGINKCKNGNCTMGVSHEGTTTNICDPYIVVLQKKSNGIEVKEIRNVKVDKQLPLDIMVIIFRLQIHLDKFEGDTVNPQQMADALNSVIPGNKFYALGDRWKEARDEFKKQLAEGKIYLTEDSDIIEEINRIRNDTPWEDYSNRLRAFIGTSIKAGVVTITSPKDSKIEKYKVFDYATEFMIGKTADYFKPFKKDC